MIRPTFRLLGRASAQLRRTRTLAVVGGASLALAVGVAFLPRLFPAGVFRPVSTVVGSPVVIVLFGVVAGLLGAQALRRTAADAKDAKGRRPAESDGSDRWTPVRAPEKAYYDEHRIAGTEIDSVFEMDPDDRRELDAGKRTARKRIRRTAISVIAADENVSPAVAAERIAAGSWTDDPRAAAFLGGRHHAPLRTRIRDWASGEQFERWATQAVAAVEARERGSEAREQGREGLTGSEEARR
jgi:hypothetical protein